MSDLVSRQAAIKNAHFPIIDDAGYEVVRVDDILALPSAEAVQGWIPVSERLPKISGLYLVSTDRYGVWSARTTMFDAGTNSWAKKGDKRATINAWMPLPEPYREDGEA